LKQRKEVNEMSVTKNLAKYTKEKAINLSAMARATGIQYPVLYASLGDKNRNRPLSIDEAILICKFLDVNPLDFAEDKAIQ
jgi:hypothetical protein